MPGTDYTAYDSAQGQPFKDKKTAYSIGNEMMKEEEEEDQMVIPSPVTKKQLEEWKAKEVPILKHDLKDDPEIIRQANNIVIPENMKADLAKEHMKLLNEQLIKNINPEAEKIEFPKYTKYKTPEFLSNEKKESEVEEVSFDTPKTKEKKETKKDVPVFKEV